MADFDVAVYNLNADPMFLLAAADALDNLESQTNFSVDVYANPVQLSDPGQNNWSDIFDTFQDVLCYLGSPNGFDWHLLIVDRTLGNPGAGASRGEVENSWGWSCNSNTPVSGVNAATKLYADVVPLYGGNGDKAYKATVLHNAIHVLVYPGQNHPSDSCYQSHSDDHSLGAIYPNENNAITPAQIWYSQAVASNNPPPCDNCSGNPNANAQNISLDMTSCAISNMETTVSTKL